MTTQPTTANDIKGLIAMVATGRPLSEADATRAFEAIMSGNATPAQIGGFLMALRVRGETVAEITAAARTMRDKAARIQAPAGAIDIVGTGGDCAGTYNISTAAALVTAACGVPVAKHGNRAASSKSGSADVLAALGVNLDADLALVERSIAEVGIGFMFAQRHHSAMKHVAPARSELGTRTIFNLLGPLANPAGARFELMGVFAQEWVEPLAEVLGRLGAERAWVVHGSDGLDEITTTGPTHVAEFRGGVVRSFDITPADAGLPLAKAEDLQGADPEANAQALRALLEGVKTPYRDIVVFNAAAALVVAGAAEDLATGAARAAQAIDSGAAKDTLARMIAIIGAPAS
ncbi:anthranilate phosphoribosyltransferase [Rhodospirillum rubrum]|uniref:Anthranilate phosphoribosyltransferase n=1 Tax=Rhodospirillum rubrum (strain ATCC 11170 / ATH 1.1.1 / DSM 467 / LMG 4362 / NCIMB 8255 / S1) TaxID=269796 RepID=TRPD_RHORT|nr:anthranilate phosphoribosyltransferase [Rhodospirillum rubrum]Q2RT49.1 RecName: Full=Anthranilate phosphoribosyltransferase [Rhodospirillum rubrum ATCC 11170]ABC22696.1 anthranilate phosphoribosyltransferase [Rhodospirillum rubrum ATCC 11170]AEO48415.1 anthranilate phosphoribosyltransferase [Rhodospirillum rubrum F11]MBK5954294.1 anthranilate phosphoribosyltransferase [Rhodospirillum rubrum]QXG78690.1 anthranilate phosphoribosyltransferase [Rhodospirillum rubrum]